MKRKPIAGTCCGCGYTGEDETPCPGLDGSHCPHWWDGPDDPIICDRCQATLQTYDTACTAKLDERCPGFNAIERMLKEKRWPLSPT